jgi:hypothetical protein
MGSFTGSEEGENLFFSLPSELESHGQENKVQPGKIINLIAVGSPFERPVAQERRQDEEGQLVGHVERDGGVREYVQQFEAVRRVRRCRGLGAGLARQLSSRPYARN